MSKLKLFTIVFLFHYKAIACTFYPQGEEVRMRFLSLEMLDLQQYKSFEYSSKVFESLPVNPLDSADANVLLWYEYLQGQVNCKHIHSCVYQLNAHQINPLNSNEMLRYLFANKDFEAIQYLKFAKRCEPLNSLVMDEWTNKDSKRGDKAKVMLRLGARRLNACKKDAIKQRYAHLLIRLAHYHDEPMMLKTLFEKHIRNTTKNAVYYWALHFIALDEQDRAKGNYLAAQVFANCSEKRIPIHYKFDKSIPVEASFEFAKTDEEKANICFLAATLNHDKSLEMIVKAHEFGLSEERLLFLLCRETNKLEDWILTVRYTQLDPPIVRKFGYWEESVFTTEQLYQLRMLKDKKYVLDILKFVESIGYQGAELDLVKAHLLFLAEKHQESLALVEKLLLYENLDSSAIEGLKVLKLFNSVHVQKSDAPELNNDIRDLLMLFQDNKRVLFCLGRNFEFKGNTKDAAILYSHLEKSYEYDFDYENAMWWSYSEISHDFYSAVIRDYFTYMDIVYNTEQIAQLLNHLDSQSTQTAFDLWYYAPIKKERERILDLLGTKHMRLDELLLAKEAYGKIGNRYWLDNYSTWRSQFFLGANYFDQNPFFTLKCTPKFIDDVEYFYLTKHSVVSKLIELKDLAENPNEKHREKYYLYIANCYANMTCTGNSWMMKRFYFSMYDFASYYEDEEEFRNSNKSKQYYNLAAKYAKNDKFKAMCYYLAKNKQRLRRLNLVHQELDIYGCYAFQEYYNAR